MKVGHASWHFMFIMVGPCGVKRGIILVEFVASFKLRCTAVRFVVEKKRKEKK